MHGSAGNAFGTQPVVTIKDAGGNTVNTSASVTLAITGGTGAAGAALNCSGGNSVAASSGVATFSGCSISTGSNTAYTLTASVSSPALSKVSAQFVVTTGAGALQGASTGTVPPAQTFGGINYATNPSLVVDNVNTATGNFTLAVTDITVAGIGMPLTLTRTYNSQDTAQAPSARVGAPIFDLSVTMAGSGNSATATVRGEDGQRVVFTANGSGGWLPPAGARSTLVCTGQSCTVTRFDGIVWHTSSGQVQDYIGVSGQGLHFGYSGGHLSTVTLTTSSGPALVVNVTEDGNGHVTHIASPTRSLSYTYSPTYGTMQTYTDVRGNTWQYFLVFNQSIRITTVVRSRPGHHRYEVTYDGSGRAISARGNRQHPAL